MRRMLKNRTAEYSGRCRARISRRGGHAAAMLLALVAGGGAPVLAGGSPEHILLIINPADADSMYLGNYYKNARNIPDRNVLYIDPGAANYGAFAGPNGNIDAVFGHLRQSRIDETIHYIVIAPTATFFVPSSGYVPDQCLPNVPWVRRFSISSAYTLAFLRETILANGLNFSSGNGYHSTTLTTVHPFDSNTKWVSGVPHASGHRLYIGALLGYTGLRGNTVGEIREMIDRSVMADGTQPAGTFYFMNTTDQNRNVRSPQFQGVVNGIGFYGGTGEILNGNLPVGRHDALGVLTGVANPDVANADMTILPGAFADHLTSYAATFDASSQTKLSAWIGRGASASSGTVEEPCAYTGKFPHAMLYLVLFRGLSMGESWLRSMAFLPFQQLLVGDPMTRPFAWFPDVEPNLPTGVVTGTVTLTPAVSATAPGASITGVEMYINGVRVRTLAPGAAAAVDTTLLPDGPNEVRFIAYDSAVVRNAGSSRGVLQVNNNGRSASLVPAVTLGHLMTRFTFEASAGGAGVLGDTELRLLHNGRVVAAAVQSGAPVVLHVHGQNLGAGVSEVRLEAVFADGRRALSAPVELEIAPTSGALSNEPPVAYGFTRHIRRGEPFVIELPASFDDALGSAAFEIVSPPGQAVAGQGTGPYRIMTAPPGAWGPDPFTFKVTTPSGDSNIATITLIYGHNVECYANCDNSTTPPALNVEDFTCFVSQFATALALPHAEQIAHYANCDGSTVAPVLNVEDFICFIDEFARGCM
jgi:hypothetical protein